MKGPQLYNLVYMVGKKKVETVLWNSLPTAATSKKCQLLRTGNYKLGKLILEKV